MKQITDILNVSKANKNYLQKCFCSGSTQLRKKSLQEYQKHQLNALFFLSIENPTELCRFLKTLFFQLEEIINNPVYKHYTIKKRKVATGKFIRLKTN